jgi:colanic acid biosynthesis protein WcaH
MKRNTMPPDEKTLLEIIKLTPLVSIDLIIYNPLGEVLLGLRRNRPARSTWFVPGGRIRKDERIPQALQRIARVELGIELDPRKTHFFGVYEHLYEDNFAGEHGISTHYVVLAHEIHLQGEMNISGDDQHTQFRWWQIIDLLSAPDVHTNTKAYFTQ